MGCGVLSGCQRLFRSWPCPRKACCPEEETKRDAYTSSRESDSCLETSVGRDSGFRGESREVLGARPSREPRGGIWARTRGVAGFHHAEMVRGRGSRSLNKGGCSVAGLHGCRTGTPTPAQEVYEQEAGVVGKLLGWGEPCGPAMATLPPSASGIPSWLPSSRLLCSPRDGVPANLRLFVNPALACGGLRRPRSCSAPHHNCLESVVGHHLPLRICVFTGLPWQGCGWSWKIGKSIGFGGENRSL